MTSRLSFGQKISLGFAAMLGLALMTAVGAIFAMRSGTAAADRVISIDIRQLVQLLNLRQIAEQSSGAARASVFTHDSHYDLQHGELVRNFLDLVAQIDGEDLTVEDRRSLDQVSTAFSAWRTALADDPSHHNAAQAEVVRYWESQVLPTFKTLSQRLSGLIEQKQHLVEESRRLAAEKENFNIGLMVILAAVACGISVSLALYLPRSMTNQVGSAIQHLQTSATELQAAATQQAATSKEQATATNEVTTTVKELLSSSRQIAESTQRVVRIAEETAEAAQTGDTTLRKAQDGIFSIKQQVDMIVGHMLDLGRKSQQIGTVLEIINELAEQTNILAINATIEAAGAGDAGKRFAVVAEEIRKLADRVGSSTKEIRGLVDDIRAAANTTVMATEQGSKATEAGTQQFAELAGSFKKISTMVVTTTDSAREIELSTRQQTTAMEQVSTAILDVAQSAEQVQAGSRQTVQVAGQLANLSRTLGELVRPEASGGVATGA